MGKPLLGLPVRDAHHAIAARRTDSLASPGEPDSLCRRGRKDRQRASMWKVTIRSRTEPSPASPMWAKFTSEARPGAHHSLTLRTLRTHQPLASRQQAWGQVAKRSSARRSPPTHRSLTARSPCALSALGNPLNRCTASAGHDRPAEGATHLANERCRALAADSTRKTQRNGTALGAVGRWALGAAAQGRIGFLQARKCVHALLNPVGNRLGGRHTRLPPAQSSPRMLQRANEQHGQHHSSASKLHWRDCMLPRTQLPSCPLWVGLDLHDRADSRRHANQGSALRTPANGAAQWRRPT